MTSSKFSIAIVASSLLALSGCVMTPTPTLVREVQFNDPMFAQCVEESGVAELAKITRLYCNSQQISNVAEIQLMPALKEIILLDNQISDIDVSHLKQLDLLILGGNQLSHIDVSHNPELIALNVSGNEITQLDVSQNPKLISLYVYKSVLTSIDVTQQPKLRDLGLSRHQLSEIDLSNNSELKMLNLSVGTLENIDVSHNPKLTHLFLSSNKIASINVSHNPALKQVALRNNQLSELDLSANARLEKVTADYNQIDTLSFNAGAPLAELVLNNNRIAKLDISTFEQLNKLVAFNNPLQTLTYNPDSQPAMLSIEGTPVALANKHLDQQGIANVLSPRVSIIEGGTISKHGDQYDVFSSQLVMPTTGQYIGFRYGVTLPKGTKGEIDPAFANQNQFPITVRMTHPEITDPKSGKGFTTSSWTDTMFTHDKNLALWYFGEKYELVEGRWTLEILYRDSVVAKRSFMLVNMDEPLTPNLTKAMNPAVSLTTLVKQGERFLCAKEKYRSCMTFDSATQCEAELKPYKAGCQQDALESIKQHPDKSANGQLQEYFSHYTACMAAHYIENTPDLEPQQVTACLQK